MPRSVILISILMATAPQSTVAADSDLSACLTVATNLEAGGDVTDKDLTAAHQACEHANERGLDPATLKRVKAAYSAIDDEYVRRKAAHLH
jgi:hypothetical protein